MTQLPARHTRSSLTAAGSLAVAAAVIFAALAAPRAAAAGRRGERRAAAGFPGRPADSPAGVKAYSCGVPTPSAEGGSRPPVQPVFPAGKYPVSLPAVSLLGARNDLPNPY